MKCSDVKPFNMTAWTDTSLIESMKSVKKEQPPSKNSKVTNEKPSEAAAPDAGGAAGDQTPPLPLQDLSSSVKVATTGEAADGGLTTWPTKMMAASVVGTAPQLTSVAREEL